MKGRLDGSSVILGPDGASLHDQGGYGRLEKSGLRLAPEEALYLVQRQKLDVEGQTFESLLSSFAARQGLFRSYLVYRDLRERGFAVQPGLDHYRLFRRGDRPGTGRSRIVVRVLSERDLVDFDVIHGELETSGHMRKDHVLAVVDDEGELTYYGVKAAGLTLISPPGPLPAIQGAVFGSTVILRGPLPAEYADAWFGTALDEGRLMLSPVEALYLVDAGSLSLADGSGPVTREGFMERALPLDPELPGKAAVYGDLRKSGYIPRTGYKFGHHFRVYALNKTHSEFLVHAVPAGGTLSVSVISRSVRLAHSVKKKMLYACVHPSGIRYIEFGRMKL